MVTYDGSLDGWSGIHARKDRSELKINKTISKPESEYINKNKNVLEAIYSPELLDHIKYSNDLIIEQKTKRLIPYFSQEHPQLSPIRLDSIKCSRGLPFKISFKSGINIVCVGKDRSIFDLIGYSLFAPSRYIRNLPLGAGDFSLLTNWIIGKRNLSVKRTSDHSRIQIDLKRLRDEDKAQHAICMALESYQLNSRRLRFGLPALHNLMLLDLSNLDRNEFPFTASEKLKIFLFGTQKYRKNLLNFEILEDHLSKINEVIHEGQDRCQKRCREATEIESEITELDRGNFLNDRHIQSYKNVQPKDLDVIEENLIRSLQKIRQDLGSFQNKETTHKVPIDPLVAERDKISKEIEMFNKTISEITDNLRYLSRKGDIAQKEYDDIEIYVSELRQCRCGKVIPEEIAQPRVSDLKCPVCGYESPGVDERRTEKKQLATKIANITKEKEEESRNLESLNQDLEEKLSQMANLEKVIAVRPTIVQTKSNSYDYNYLMTENDKIQDQLLVLRNDRRLLSENLDLMKKKDPLQAILKKRLAAKEIAENSLRSIEDSRELVRKKAKELWTQLKREFADYEYAGAQKIEEAITHNLPPTARHKVPNNILPQFLYSTIYQRILSPEAVNDPVGVLFYYLSLLQLSISGDISSPKFLLVENISSDLLKEIQPVLIELESKYNGEFQLIIAWDSSYPEFLEPRWKVDVEGLQTNLEGVEAKNNDS